MQQHAGRVHDRPEQLERERRAPVRCASHDDRVGRDRAAPRGVDRLARELGAHAVRQPGIELGEHVLDAGNPARGSAPPSASTPARLRGHVDFLHGEGPRCRHRDPRARPSRPRGVRPPAQLRPRVRARRDGVPGRRGRSRRRRRSRPSSASTSSAPRPRASASRSAASRSTRASSSSSRAGSRRSARRVATTRASSSPARPTVTKASTTAASSSRRRGCVPPTCCRRSRTARST